MRLSLLVLLAACGGSQALRTPAEMERTAYGSFVELQLRKGGIVAGELIAIEDTEVSLLDVTGFRRIPTASILVATLSTYKPSGSDLVVWGLAGILSTLSHGVYLVFSAPVWLITTIGSGTAEHAAPVQVWKGEGRLSSWRPFARFPQGLPPDYDTSRLGRFSTRSPP